MLIAPTYHCINTLLALHTLGSTSGASSYASSFRAEVMGSKLDCGRARPIDGAGGSYYLCPWETLGGTLSVPPGALLTKNRGVLHFLSIID